MVKETEAYCDQEITDFQIIPFTLGGAILADSIVPDNFLNMPESTSYITKSGSERESPDLESFLASTLSKTTYLTNVQHERDTPDLDPSFDCLACKTSSITRVQNERDSPDFETAMEQSNGLYDSPAIILCLKGKSFIENLIYNTGNI